MGRGDGRQLGVLAVAACVLLWVLAPAASATLQASVDAGALVLTDAGGSADDVSLSSNGAGVFVALAGAGSALGPVCPLVSVKFHGFQCSPPTLVRLDAGGGNDEIDAARLATPLQVTLGSGSDVLVGGSGSDTIATVADGVRDVVDCGAGHDVVDGVADPNDDVAADCETAQRSFASGMLPKALTVGPSSTVTLAIGRANVPLSFEATLGTAPPKHGKHAKARSLGHTTLPATTGAVKLRFKLPTVSKGFLSRRPDLRVEVAVTAIGGDGRRYPLQLHAQAPGPHPKLVTLYDNQVRLKIPARLRHPHGAG
jgi:hypothetical protein